jgi:hypothetical protein
MTNSTKNLLSTTKRLISPMTNSTKNLQARNIPDCYTVTVLNSFIIMYYDFHYLPSFVKELYKQLLLLLRWHITSFCYYFKNCWFFLNIQFYYTKCAFFFPEFYFNGPISKKKILYTYCYCFLHLSTYCLYPCNMAYLTMCFSPSNHSPTLFFLIYLLSFPQLPLFFFILF